MKICVYAIALNEAKHVARFMSTAREADCVVVADTGSTDGTVELLRAEGAVVHSISVVPWRFDDARNAALALVPADVDVCVVVDLDEVLEVGWAEKVRAVWQPGVHTRGRYWYVWSHNEDGSPGVCFVGDRVHSRAGFRWVHPCHETLTPDRTVEVPVDLGYELHHWSDDSKSRGQYLPLLEVAAAERPDDPRTAHYLGREYMYRGMWDEARHELQRHLGLPGALWKPERAASMRFLSRIARSVGDLDEARNWAHLATAECPELREVWVDYAQVCHDTGLWDECLRAALRAVGISERPGSYLSEPFAWGERPWDLASVAAWQVGNVELAVEMGRMALSLAPGDERIARNVEFFESSRVGG